MWEAIIFDMDGVLIDSEPVYLRDTYTFLKNHGIEVNYKDLYVLIGISSDSFWQTIADMWKTKITIEEIETLYNKETQIFHYQTVIFPHVTTILSNIKERGIKIGLASSSPMENIKTVLQDCQITEYFDVIVSGESFKESKPNPEIYVAAMTKLGAHPKKCIAVEDSSVGIEAAKRAGMYVVAKEERRFGFNQNQADCRIMDLLELLDVMETRAAI